MPKIYDNIENILTDGLNNTLNLTYRSDFCVGYFNLRGWKEVAGNIDKYAGEGENCCRLLVGMNIKPSDELRKYYSAQEEIMLDNKEANRLKKQLAQEFKDQLTIGVPTNEDEKGLRQLSRQIKENKVKVKLFLKHNLHAKLYLCFRNDPINPKIAYLGSSNLTLAGLSKQGELNVDVLEQDAVEKLCRWFNGRWEEKYCVDISSELAEIIDNSWASEKLIIPYHIYLKIAYHLSLEARTGVNEFKIPKVFRDRLLEFQEKAVLIAAHHLHKRGGVIIGDVVGLGKTITACAIAKIFEDDFSYETLIISPKNLVSMWENYSHEYQLRTKILSITEAQKKLPEMPRYRQVIIDESHNLRNRNGIRYGVIKEYLNKNASQVILLTATPYNKDFTDLSNQLRLFIDGEDDLGISPEKFINSLGGQVEFSAKYQAPVRSLNAFEKSTFIDDWRELMRLYLVRRTRSFIKKYYAEYDKDKNRTFISFSDGRRSYFPDRIPKKVLFGFDGNVSDDQYAKLYSDKVVATIRHLNLPRYGLGNYICEEDDTCYNPTKQEMEIMENLSKAGKRLIGFARTNLFKRLESSGYAFLLSLLRHIARNYIFIYAIQNNEKLPVGQQEADVLDEFIEDMDLDDLNSEGSKVKLNMNEEEFLALAQEIYPIFRSNVNSKYKLIRSELFNSNLAAHLLQDSRALISILNLCGTWKADKDRKLTALKELIFEKHKDDKILVFTQFADTAGYLINEIKGNDSSIECVTGANENPTSYAQRFSPESNKITPNVFNPEIRVLITTDVLSEGQNLQDGHIIVNYDLPWAIIRLIQRAGRVDRIGQKSHQIICYSFLPEEGLENIIKLRNRLKARINSNAEVVGSDEVFFDGDPVNINDLYNEKAGIFDEEENGEIDLSSYAYQIWMDAVKADSKLNNIIPNMPNVVNSTKESGENPEGVIVYAKTYDDNDVLTLLNEKGGLITQSQLKILKMAECSPGTPALEKIEKHYELVKNSLPMIKDFETAIGGQLGKKSSARYKVYTRLDEFYKRNKDSFFEDNELKKVIDNIYKFPLKENAKEAFNRQLKAGIDDDGLVKLARDMNENDSLCIVENGDGSYFKEPKIICSMGLKKC